MSGKKRRRLLELAELEKRQIASRQRRRRVVAGTLFVFAVVAALVFWFSTRKPDGKQATQGVANSAEQTGKKRASDEWTLDALLATNPQQLGDVDIALMNLLCAGGLRGSESLDVRKSLVKLDEMAARVKQETERHMYRFKEKPGDYENSEPYFRMMMIAVVLQEDFGARYNPDRITTPGNFEPNDKFFADSKDVFLHGLTGPPMMGTCSSMPVLYTAVARRLKYPLVLVATKNHLFCRWDDGTTRMNMDATGSGFTSDSDDYYKTWPYKVTEQEVAEHGFLKSMTPAEELACFMSLRGACLEAKNHWKSGIQAYQKAMTLAPDVLTYRLICETAQRRLAMRQAQQVMSLIDQEMGVPSLRSSRGNPPANQPTNQPANR